MTNRARLAPLTLLAAAGLATLTASAWAQDRQPPERRAQREDRPTLSGPHVREQRVPGTESGFSAGAESMGPRMAQAVPAPVFHKALGDLMAEDAPLDIRLSPEQRERITAHMRAFEQHAREQLADGPRQRRESGPRETDRAPDRRDPRAGRDDDRPRRQGDRVQPDRPGDDRPRSDRRPTDRPQGDRPQTDREANDAPRDPHGDGRGQAAQALAGLQHRIWAELSAAQQAHVGGVIHAWREQVAAEQMGRTRERYRKEIGARFDEMESNRPQRAGGDRANPDHGPSELRQWFSSLPEEARQRLRERLGEMPAERREALIARMTEMSPEQRAGVVRRLLQSEGRPSEPRRPQ